MRRKTKIVLAAAALASLTAFTGNADEVEWVFEGDITRSPVSAAESVNDIASFVSWTTEPSVDESDSIPFRTTRRMFYIILR